MSDYSVALTRSALLVVLIAPVQATDLMDVAITSIPSGANIDFGGTRSGRTPTHIKVAPGEYTLKLTLVGFQTWLRQIKVQPEHVNAVNAELTRLDTVAPSKTPNPAAKDAGSDSAKSTSDADSRQDTRTDKPVHPDLQVLFKQWEKEDKENAAAAAREKRLAVERQKKQAEEKKKKAEEAAKTKGEQEAKVTEERAKIRANCSAIYRATADKKMGDITVREAQQVNACQALGLYRP